MKLYGSLNNRLEENKVFTEDGLIHIGDGCTEYLYSDSHAYEVTNVINQKEVLIRRFDTKRIDDNGMSDSQEYEYISNKNNPEIHLVKRNNVWYKVNEYSKKALEEIVDYRFEKGSSDMKTKEAEYKYLKWHMNLTESQNKKFEEGKSVKKFIKFGNISFGVAQEYFDYCF